MTSQRQFAIEAESIRKVMLENADSDKAMILIQEEIGDAVSRRPL